MRTLEEITHHCHSLKNYHLFFLAHAMLLTKIINQNFNKLDAKQLHPNYSI
jgi:hypothetical protein